ncbi:MAG: UvrD-helicase domain-containing protein, partial [Fusobacteriaceae bacterium]
MGKKIVLRASAGTGKTYRLSLEYLATLFRGENYKDIIVMTFTKKATAEIKERIIEFLEEIFRNKNNKKDELINNLKSLHPDLEITENKIESYHNEISENIDRLRIFTIDGFINTIFKSSVAPFLGVSSYEIIDEDQNNEMFIRLFERIFKSEKSFKIFQDFLENNTEKNLEKYIDILKNLVSDRWKMILLDDSNISREKNILGDSNSDEQLQKCFELFKNCMEILDIMAQKKGKQNHYEVLKKDFQEYELTKNYFVENFKIFFDMEDNGDQKFPWNGNLVRNSKEIILDEEKEDFKKIYKEFLGELAIYFYDTEIIKYERDVLTFINELYKNYDEMKFSEGGFSFADISNYTFKYFKNKELNLFDGKKLTKYFKDIFDSNISTIFIDEFQDTSILQWKLLKEIVDCAENVICVGDEKQSIYGWRGGEKKLFEELDRLLSAEKNSLSTCFRSKKNLTEYTNLIFKNLSGTHNWNFENVSAKSEELGHTETIFSNDDKNSEEPYENIRNILLEKFEQNYNGVAIISRKNKDLNLMAQYLADAGIPFVQESNENIFCHRVNAQIYKFIKYLVFDDFMMLVEFLRSDVVKLDSKNLKTLLTKNFENLNLEILEKVREIKNIYSIGKLDSKNIILKIIESFNITQKYSSPNDMKNLYRFLEIINLYENFPKLIQVETENPSSSEFSQVASESQNAVTLISIHKSKGLEFDTVFYLYKSSRGGNSGFNLDFTIELDKNYEELKNFLILNKKYLKLIPHLPENFEYIKLQDEKEKQEEINSFYVGLTRAKTNLFIVTGKLSEKDIFKSALEVASFENTKNFKLEPKILENILEKNLEKISEENKILD